MSAAVSIGQREFGIAHLLAGRFCSASQRSIFGRGKSLEYELSGRYVRRGSVIASEAMLLINWTSRCEVVLDWQSCREMLFRFKVGCVGLCLVFPAEIDFCPMNTRELPRRLYITNSLPVV